MIDYYGWSHKCNWCLIYLVLLGAKAPHYMVILDYYPTTIDMVAKGNLIKALDLILSFLWVVLIILLYQNDHATINKISSILSLNLAFQTLTLTYGKECFKSAYHRTITR